MIYTITLNPSIDFIVKLTKLELGETNRSDYYEFQAGGKGIMVSKLLKNVGTKSINLGFLGGFTSVFYKP